MHMHRPWMPQCAAAHNANNSSMSNVCTANCVLADMWHDMHALHKSTSHTVLLSLVCMIKLMHSVPIQTVKMLNV
jgi:hypothetical protein